MGYHLIIIRMLDFLFLILFLELLQDIQYMFDDCFLFCFFM